MVGVTLTNGLRFGVCVDDAWRYMGFNPPPSIVIPHIFLVPSISTRIRIKEAVGRLHFPRKKINLSLVKSLARTLKESGIDYVRFWLQWNFVQPELPAFDASPRYNWTMVDTFISVLKQAGIELLPVVGCGYQRMLPRGVDPTRNLAFYVKAIHESTREIVRRYKGLIRTWQIENEPNWWFAHYVAGWRKGVIWIDPQASKFREMLLSSLRDAVLTEDCNAQVMINLEIDRSIRNLSSYARYCDLIGLDYYPNYSHARPVDASSLIPKAKKVFEETGRRVMVCETGYPSGPSLLGYSKALQAIYIEKLREAVSDEPLIEAVSIWRLSDSEWKSFPWHENHFGLVEADGTPKPSWHAFLAWIKKAS